RHDDQPDEDETGGDKRPNPARPPSRPAGKPQPAAAGGSPPAPLFERQGQPDADRDQEEQDEGLRPDERHLYFRRRRRSVAMRTIARTRSSSVESDIAS